MKKGLIILLSLGALGVAGCKTTTEIDRVGTDHFTVEDSGSGANPEKGLRDTCPKIGRQIVGYKKANIGAGGDTIIVTCGDAAP